ncbi:hypothetical protein AAVH_16695 [Aphelenchoides avenae]|nr:hypothetical protein AAVH_16695 [Aphelenchus avenae]
MRSSTLFGLLFFLAAVAFDNELDIEFDSAMKRVLKMNDLREIFDEIPREGGRAVLTVGTIPLLMRADRIRHFLEQNEEFALEFGKLGRIVFYLANLYLNMYSAGDWETVADLMASIRKSKLAQGHREL